MSPETLSRPLIADAGLHAALRRLAPTLSRIAADTAGALLGAGTAADTDPAAAPRFRDLGAIRCSQRNLGETHEMVMNLAADKAEWDRLFPAGESEEYRMDAFRELANCICGGMIGEPAFADEFGCLIPCVPYAGRWNPPADSACFTGAFRRGGAWIRYTLSVRQIAGLRNPALMVA